MEISMEILSCTPEGSVQASHSLGSASTSLAHLLLLLLLSTLLPLCSRLSQLLLLLLVLLPLCEQPVTGDTDSIIALIVCCFAGWRVLLAGPAACTAPAAQLADNGRHTTLDGRDLLHVINGVIQ
jgi:hypothetical protein